MRWLLIYLAERLARDPALRARFHAALDALPKSAGKRLPEDRVINHTRSVPSWPISQEALPLGYGNGTRARSLIWTLGGGLLLLWVLLVGGAYGFWAMSGDWLITQTNAISRGAGLPSELAGPFASAMTLARDLVGPILAVIGVAVSAVILVVTALAARLLGGLTRG